MRHSAPAPSAFVSGDAGVLAPGRWRWLRTIAWMLALWVGASALLFPGWLHQLGIDPAWGKPVLLVVAYVAYAAAIRWGERRAPGEIAPRALAPEMVIGLLIGAGMFALVFASLRLTGSYTLAPGQWSDWPHDILATLHAAFGEELLFRLIAFRLLVRLAGIGFALIVSAALFGALHLLNPHASLVAAMAIAVEAGLMLAGFYLVTGRIWMSIGVHAAWNFMQGPLFGARVSGGTDSGSLFTSAPLPGVSDIVSGGAFGPEASLSAIVVGFAVFAATIAVCVRRWRGERCALVP